MQYDENAEKYGYEGEMTPMKCDELKAYKGDVYIPVYGSIADADVYLKKDADTAIAELKEFAEDACLERDDNQTAIDELQAENAELKQKLENVNEFIKESKELLKESQKMHQRCADGAIKKIRHNKYKRCLAMAQEWRSYATFCGMQSSWHNNRGFGKTAEKWTWKECHAWTCVKRWLELAEKFKEAK